MGTDFVIELRALVCALAAFAIPSSPAHVEPDPCPAGRTLEQQIDAADVVALGEVIYDRDCLPPSVASDRVFGDCIGTRADVRVVRAWKGSLQPGNLLGLVVFGPGDSRKTLLRKGDVKVVFAKARPATETLWWGDTDVCWYPAGFKSDSALAKALDAWMKSHPRNREM